MDRSTLQHRETLLLEVLLSSLDARESAKQAGAPMLVYLTELSVRRAREELADVRRAIEAIEIRLSEDGAAA